MAVVGRPLAHDEEGHACYLRTAVRPWGLAVVPSLPRSSLYSVLHVQGRWIADPPALSRVAHPLYSRLATPPLADGL